MDDDNTDALMSTGIKSLANRTTPPACDIDAIHRELGRRRRTRRAVAAGAGVCAVGLLAGIGFAALAHGGSMVDPSASTSPTDYKSLTADEFSLALRIAKDEQAKVQGTFIGATALAADAATLAANENFDCRQNHMIRVRLVWDADASFVHGGVPGDPSSDGPRKALLEYIDPQTGSVCGESSMFRNVGASPAETLLYGTWPDPADG